MSSRARFLVTSLTALLIVAVTSLVWAGPPPRDSRSRDTDRNQNQPNQSQNNQAGNQGGDGGQGSGFSFSGGVGPGSVAGGVGACPQLVLEKYTNQRERANYLQSSYPIRYPDHGIDISLSGDWLTFGFKGETNYDDYLWVWSANIQLRPGDLVKSNLQTNYIRLSADFNMMTPHQFGGVGSFKLGPRVQLFSYNHTFYMENVTLGWNDTESRSHLMPAIGVAGSLELPYVSSLTSLASVTPRFKFASTFGGSNGMRYFSYEGFAEFQVGLPHVGGSVLPNFGVLLQLGYIGIRFNGKYDRRGENPGAPDATANIFGSYTAQEDYSVRYPVLRASLSF